MQRLHSPRALHLAIAAALGLCLTLPVAAQDASSTTSQANRPDKSSMASSRDDASSAKASDRRFLEKATAGNEKEVAAATVGQQKAVSRDVRDYAAHLLRDHQDMLVKLDETSVALGVSSTRRYTAMTGWGSGMRDDSDSRSAQASASASGVATTDMDNTDMDDTADTAAGGTRTTGTVTGRATGTTSAGSAATDAGATASAAGRTGYETPTMASTDTNTAATGSTSVQAVPASASGDPMVRKLAAQSGEAFDRAFVDQMVADHKKTIAEFERASRDDTLSEKSRMLASNALPTLRTHLAMAESLRGNLSGSKSAP